MKKILPWLGLAHALAFILFWLTNPLYYRTLNDFLARAVGVRLDFITIFLALGAAFATWSAARIILARRGKKIDPTWPYNMICGLFILLVYANFVIIFLRDPSQLARLYHLVGYYRFFFDLPFLFLLAYGLTRFIRSARRRWRQPSRIFWGCVGIMVLTTFLLAASPPANILSRSPGNNMTDSQYPPRPLIVAHRGASMLAPENTLASAEKAAALSVFGLEADVRVSRDGTLFLMHDDTLARTTNVAAVFPARVKENASNFTFSELRQLSAGRWFTETDPFGTIAAGLVSPAELNRYQVEKIPSLAEVLDVVKKEKLAFAFFDLLPPPEGHPYDSQFFDICLRQLKDAGIDSQVWIQVNEKQLFQVRDLAPQMKLVAHIDAARPPAPEELINQGYSAVNSENNLPSALIRAYRRAGLWVNLWTIDEPWLFSRFWQEGVDSITTNNSHSFSALQQPVLSLPAAVYFIFWGLAGLLALAMLVITFLRLPRIHDDD